MPLPFDQPVLAVPPASVPAPSAGFPTPGKRPRRALAAVVVFVVVLHAVVIWGVWRGHLEVGPAPQGQAIDVSLMTAEPSSERALSPAPEKVGRVPGTPDDGRQPVSRVAPVMLPPMSPREPSRAGMAEVLPNAEAPPQPSDLSAREALLATSARPPATTGAPGAPHPATPPVGGSEAAGPGAAPPRHLPSSAVTYAVPPVKVYPEASRSLDESGVVQVGVLVDEKGRAAEVRLERSSGYSRLDRAALTAARGARFNPYIEAGSARAFWVTIPFNFDLED
jgi:protein TonB